MALNAIQLMETTVKQRTYRDDLSFILSLAVSKQEAVKCILCCDTCGIYLTPSSQTLRPILQLSLKGRAFYATIYSITLRQINLFSSKEMHILFFKCLLKVE
jgi:hypothetical protein